MTTVSDYQDAYRKHEAALKAANDVVQQVYNISNAINGSLRSFMGWNFDVRIDNHHERFEPKSKVDVSKWPNAESLGAILKAWNEADSALRQAWTAVSAEDRAGLTSPPHQMQLSASRY